MERAVQSVRATLPDEENPSLAPPPGPAIPPADSASIANDERTALDLDLEAMRAAIHGMNRTVSELAERAKRSGDETAARINALAKAAAAMGSKIAAGAEDIERLDRKGEDGFAALDERLRSAEARLDGFGRFEGAVSGLATQFVGLDRLEEKIDALERNDAEGAARHTALAARIGSIEAAAESMRSEADRMAARLSQTEAALPRMEEAIQALDVRSNGHLQALEEKLSALTVRIAALDDVEKSVTTLLEEKTAIAERIGGIEGTLAGQLRETAAAVQRLQSAEEKLVALPALEGRLSAFDETLNAKFEEIGRTVAAASARADDMAGRVHALEQLPANRGDLDVATAVKRIAVLDELEKKISSFHETHAENLGAIGALQDTVRTLAEETQAVRGILDMIGRRLDAAEQGLGETFRRGEAAAAISGLSELIVTSRDAEKDRTARQQAWLEQKLLEIGQKNEENAANRRTEFAESLARLEQVVATTERRLSEAIARDASAAEDRFAALTAHAADNDRRHAELHEDVRLRLAELEEKFARSQTVMSAPPEIRPEPAPAPVPAVETTAAAPETPPLIAEAAARAPEADLLPPRIEPAPLAAVSQPLAMLESPAPARLAYLEKMRSVARASAERSRADEKKGLLGGKYGLHVRLAAGFVLVAVLAVIAYAFAFHAAGERQTESVASHGIRAQVARRLAVAPKRPQASRVVSALPSDLAAIAARAAHGDQMAMLRLGLAYAEGDGVSRDDADAAAWLGRAANAGQPVAQYLLGLRFEKGIGVPKDPAQAFKWFQAAAQHGNRKAMLNLGDILANGTGTQKNLVDALHWFQAAANLGLRDAQFNLAVMYERGFGTAPSLVEAYKWYSIASASGDEESRARAGALATQIPDADKAAADRFVAAFAPQPLDVTANMMP